jgi:hypothetical protein
MSWEMPVLATIVGSVSEAVIALKMFGGLHPRWGEGHVVSATAGATAAMSAREKNAK